MYMYDVETLIMHFNVHLDAWDLVVKEYMRT